MELSVSRMSALLRGTFMTAVVAAALLGAPHAAWAQDMGKRVDKLEKELGAVQRKVFGPGYVPPADDGTSQQSPLANMEVRINALEGQMQTLTGQVEELRFKNEELARRLEGFMSDAEFRFNSLEGKGGKPAGAAMGGAAGAASGAAAGGATAIAEGEGAELAEPEAAKSGGKASGGAAGAGNLPGGTPIEQYNYAYSLLSQGKYDASQKAFEAFLAQNPKDELAGNANYWLGQTYFVRGQFEQAAKVFLEGYQAYPKSTKAPDYLLKIGVSLTKINQKPDACAVFSELKTRFPNSPAAKERMPAARKDAGCK